MSANTDADRIKRSIDWGVACLLLAVSGGFAVASETVGGDAAELAAVLGMGFMLLAIVCCPLFADGINAFGRAVRQWRENHEVSP